MQSDKKGEIDEAATAAIAGAHGNELASKSANQFVTLSDTLLHVCLFFAILQSRL